MSWRSLPVLFVVACGGGAPTVTPVSGPAPVTRAEPAVAAPASAPADAAAVRALLPADAPSEPIVNELSGENDGTNVTIASAMDVGGLPCAAGAVSIDDEGWGCQLSGSWSFGAWRWKAGAWVGRFYGTGKPRAIVLSDLDPAQERLDVDGIPCRDYVHLHPVGKIAGCQLAVDHTVDGLAFKAGSDVRFDVDGHATDAALYDVHTFGGKEYQPGMFSFSNGTVTEAAEGVYGD